MLNALLVVAALATTSPDVAHPDPVIARVLAHLEVRPIVVVVDRSLVGDAMWARVKNLNAFRVHRADGSTDAPVFVVKGAMYAEAAKSLDVPNADVWCKWAAVIMHELQHNAAHTERAALEAERAQVERCANDGHFASHGATYVMELARKVRNVKEHQ
jgi:hypothetical protein